MGLFIDNRAQADAPGVYAIEVAAPVVIGGISNGRAGHVFQSEWGPDNTVKIPDGSGDLMNTFFPPGTPRNSKGYYSLMGRRKGVWALCRALHSDATQATHTISATGGNVVITAKYKGVQGKQIAWAQTAGSDGVTDHIKLTVTMTDTNTGTTSEVYDNIPLPVSSVAPVIDTSRSLLLASITVGSGVTAWASNSSGTLSTAGSNGSAVTAADYNANLALLALRDDVRVVTVDDCGSSLRATVNADLVTHVQSTTDRMAVLQGDTNQSLSAVLADKLNYVSDRIIYVGAWPTCKDDLGVSQETPLTTFIATVLCNLEPQQSHAWHDDIATQFYTAIDGISTNCPFNVQDASQGGVQGQCTANGVTLPIRLASGKWGVLNDRTTNLTKDKKFAVTRRLKDFHALSIKAGIESWTNGPNVEDRQQALIIGVQDYVNRQTRAGRFSTKGGQPIVSDAGLNDVDSIADGGYAFGVNGRTPTVMEKIFIMLNTGPTVTVTAP